MTRRLVDDPDVASLVARCTFPDPHAPEPHRPESDEPVTLAVSGGADSAAMLVLAVAAGLDVVAAHVDHGLRVGSGDDAAVVERLAHRFDVEFEGLTVTLEPGADLEARARLARHAAVGEHALFGHTLDDQAETVLLRLLRGTGPNGLAAMRPERHPILGLRRWETRALCDRLGIETVEDPSNLDARFTRNRVRHEVLPLLRDVAGRDVAPLLARLATQAAEQSDALGLLADDVDATDVATLRELPRAVAIEALRGWWMSVTDAAHPPDAAAVQRMLDVAHGHSTGCDVVEGWRLSRHRGRLSLSQSARTNVGR